MSDSAALQRQEATPPLIDWRTTILASLGGALEFYDFIVYGIFAPYIAVAFFPSSDPLTSLVNAFAAFAIGYLSRPIGGIVLSHFGDRFGRRKIFLFSLLLMTVAIVGMALMPSYQSLGIVATAGFVFLRFVQGFCVGGELPGAITYVVEAAPRRAGLACGVVFFFVNTGVFLASSISTGLHAALSPADMQSFGWRIAFGFGGLLGIVSYLLRNKLDESPAFQRLREARLDTPRIPLFELLSRSPMQLVIGIGVTALVQAFNGVLFASMVAYMTRVAGYDGWTAAASVNLGIGVLSAGILVVGWASDRAPRRYFHRFGAVLFIIGSYPAYQAVVGQTINPYLLFALIGLVGALANGTFGVILADLFPTAVRFSGVAFTYNVSAAVFSGFAPLAVAWLVSSTGHKAAPGFYLVGVGVVALIANLGVRRSMAPPGS